MFGKTLAALAATLTLAMAAPAGAVTFVLNASGVIDTATASTSGLDVGAPVNFTATFDALHTLAGASPGTHTGYTFAQQGPVTGIFHGAVAPYTVTAGPWTWVASYDLTAGVLQALIDTTPGAERVLWVGPTATFTDSHVSGIQARALTNFTSPLQPGFSPNGGTFTIEKGSAVWTGHWDLANSTVRALGAPGAVPEPSTWAMLLLGFGLLGAAMRRSRPALA